MHFPFNSITLPFIFKTIKNQKCAFEFLGHKTGLVQDEEYSMFI
jgi:hypothetical protein